jgi:dynein heavy chain
MQDQSWPDNVKKEFLSQLHKFMATLTEHSHQQEGFTELYIPNEDLTNLSQAAHDKDLLQRLEATLLHWYRQIKDIVNNQDS